MLFIIETPHINRNVKQMLLHTKKNYNLNQGLNIFPQLFSPNPDPNGPLCNIKL